VGGAVAVGAPVQFGRVRATPRVGVGTMGYGGELAVGVDFDAVTVGVAGGYSTLGWHVGLDADWARTQERFEKELNRSAVENHIDELSKLGPATRYQEIQSNPEKYPELYQALYIVEALPGAPDFPSKMAVLDEIFKMFENILAEEAVSESFPIIRGFTSRVVVVGGFLPVPIIGIDFGIAHRDLVVRLADYEYDERYTHDAVAQEIMKQYENSKNVKVMPRTIAVSEKILVDENTGRLALSRFRSAEVDWNSLDPYKRFESQVEKATGIELTPMMDDEARKGLVRLDVRKAYGEIIVNIDPELRDKGILVWEEDALYLNLDRAQEVSISREDITFPFPIEHTETPQAPVERTYITISGNPYVTRAVSGGVMEGGNSPDMTRSPQTPDICRRPERSGAAFLCWVM